MKRPIDQALNFVSQDTIAALNEMVADGKFLMHLNMLEQLETTILSDDTGCFADQSENHVLVSSRHCEPSASSRTT